MSVPRGSDLSPIIYNIYAFDTPKINLSRKTTLAAYTDHTPALYASTTQFYPIVNPNGVDVRNVKSSEMTHLKSIPTQFNIAIPTTIILSTILYVLQF